MNELQSVQTLQTPIGEELVKKWVDWLDVGSKQTIITYSKAMHLFLEWMQKNSISNPQRSDIIHFREELSANKKKPNTINTYLAAIRLFFRWTQTEGIYPNVADHIKNVKMASGHKKDYMTPEAIRTLLESIDQNSLIGARDYALLLLAFTTGLRLSAMIEANIEDIFDRNGQMYLKFRNKGHADKDCLVKLALPVHQAIDFYLSKRGAPENGEPLFIGHANRNRGKRLKNGTVRDMFKQRLKDIGIESDRLSFHSCRHSAISIALRNGATISQVQAMSMHQSLSSLAHYAHELEREQNDVELKICDAIFPVKKA